MTYYMLQAAGREADLYIFGDIVTPGWQWYDSDVSGYSIVQELTALDADLIRAHINSYGGVVSEGLAIHNSLVSHKAKIETYCDGFACSAASVVFMAGEKRFMYPASLLMIHNAWSYAAGNADELRKEADALETISNVAANAYRERVIISDEELTALLDAETWIPPEDALRMGFATGILAPAGSAKAMASARGAVFARMTRTPVPVRPALEVKPESVPEGKDGKSAGAFFNFK